MATTFRWSDIEHAIEESPLMIEMDVPHGIVTLIIDTAMSWHWDKNMSFGITLDEECLELSHYGRDSPNQSVTFPGGWQTTRGNICLDDRSGYTYEWDIGDIQFNPNYGDVIIGVLADDGKRPQSLNSNNARNSFSDTCEIWAWHSTNKYSKGGWSVHLRTSRDLGCSGPAHDKQLNDEFRSGSGAVITTVYDSKNKTLKFKKSGKCVRKEQQGDEISVYENVKGDIFPFVTVYDHEASAKLMAVRWYRS